MTKMTRVNTRTKAKNGKVNGQESEENAKDSKECEQSAKEEAIPTKVTEVKVKGLKDSVDLVQLHGLGNGEDVNYDLADFEDLLDGVKVEGNEDELNSEEADEEEEEEEEEDEEDDDDDEDDEEEEEGNGEIVNEESKVQLGEDGKVFMNGGVRYQCESCDYSFARKSMLIRHIRIHTGERPYECEKCDAKFTQPGGLKTHMLCKHRDVLDQKDQVLYQCHHCDRSFLIKERLRIHLRVHTGELPYDCHICSKKFRRNGGLLQHLRRHIGMRPYTCEICKASYYNSTNLKTHMKRHLGVQDYVCELCGKGFTRRDGLRKHLACLHYDHCAFRCSICNKSFKGHILSHLRMHLKEKPFKCEECGMRFVQSSQLVVHKRTHSGVKPYPCQICKVAFSHSSALRMHIRRHTGEKPVKCLLCPAAFVQLPHLKKHMRCIHKSEKPYVCVPCYVFFRTKAELDEHVTINGCKQPEPPTPPQPSPESTFFVKMPPLEDLADESASGMDVAMPGEMLIGELPNTTTVAVPLPVLEQDPRTPSPAKRTPKRKADKTTNGDAETTPVKKPRSVKSPVTAVKQSPSSSSNKDVTAATPITPPKPSSRGSQAPPRNGRKASTSAEYQEPVTRTKSKAKVTPNAPAPKEKGEKTSQTVKEKGEKSSQALKDKGEKTLQVVKEKGDKISLLLKEKVERIPMVVKEKMDKIPLVLKEKAEKTLPNLKEKGEISPVAKEKDKMSLDTKEEGTSLSQKPGEKSEPCTSSMTKPKNCRKTASPVSATPQTRSRGKVAPTAETPTIKTDDVSTIPLVNANEESEDLKIPTSSPSRRPSSDAGSHDQISKFAETQTHEQGVNKKSPLPHVEDNNEPQVTRERSESPAGVSIVTLPICEPLKPVDQPHSAMVEEMMLAVTNRLKLGGTPRVVVRSQPMPIEKIRMLLAILLTRISTPDRLKVLGFGKILIDDVLCASIVSSGREPCDKNGLSEREVILKNVRILLDWTVPKMYMDRFKRENRSTEDLLEELTS